MNHTLAIAAREMVERRRVFVLAGALALVPFMVGLTVNSAEDVRMVIGMTGVILALGMGYGLAITIGSSTVAKELADRRFSFHLTKPISPASIWLGKLVAGVLTSVLCFVIIALPALIAAPEWRRSTPDATSLLEISLAGLVAAFLLSHTLGTFLRSRSWLIGVDFLCLLLAVAVGYHLTEILALGSFRSLQIFLVVLPVFLVVVLAIVPIWQIKSGRADLRRNHVYLSRTLWLSVGGALLLASGYVMWVSRPSLAAVQPVAVQQSPSGDRAFIGGVRRDFGDFHVGFLASSMSDFRRWSIPPWADPSWSADGTTVAWLRPEFLWFRGVGFDLVADSTRHRRSVTLDVSGPVSFVLSDEGSRVAVMEAHSVHVYDLWNERLLMSASLPKSSGALLTFVSPDLVRVYQSNTGAAGTTLGIAELDLKARKIAVTGEVPDAGRAGVSLSADRSRMLIRATGAIADARTGATLSQLPLRSTAPLRATMLSDGRVAVVNRTASGPKLHLFSSSGDQTGVIAFEDMQHLFISAETHDGKLLAGGIDSGPEGARDRRMYVIDPAEARVERVLPNLWGPLPRWDADARLRRFSEGVRLVAVDPQHRLVRWNPNTGERTPF